MKDWAIEKGATHYTHWFQPMTGITAEKHDIVVVDQNSALIDNFVNIYDVDINDRQSRWRGST